MAKNNKAGKKAKDLPTKSLAADAAKQVVGGRGSEPEKYMTYKFSEALITQV